MILGIDASNISAGGGVTHVQKILQYAEPEIRNISQVIVWGGRNPLDQLPPKSWLDFSEISSLNKPFHRRIWWQQNELSKLVQKDSNLLFVPVGAYLGRFRPYVTMFQNMQIFETKEREESREEQGMVKVEIVAIDTEPDFPKCFWSDMSLWICS